MMALHRLIEAEGLNLERFIRQAAAQGVELRDMERAGGRRLTASVDVKSLPLLREMADKGGWRLKVGRLVGAGRQLSRLRARLLLTAIAAVMLVLTWLGTQVMWHVQLVDAGAYTADIRQALLEMGIAAPMLRIQVDTAKIRDALEWRYPRIAWIECGWRGMAVVIRVVEGGVAEDVENGGPCDVVAVRDGVVHSIVTRAGTPVVKAGEVVRAGQVLIRGEERTSGGEVRQVAARGTVMARVWEQTAVQTSLRQTETIYTGNTYVASTVVSPWFSLWQAEASGYEHADVSVKTTPLGGLFIPLWIQTETHYEADFRSVLNDYRSVLEKNNRAALLKLQEIAGGKESLVDNWVNWSIIEDEILLSVATGEMLVDIAQQERSSGMAATE